MKLKSLHSRIAFGWIVGVRREVLKKIGFSLNANCGGRGHHSSLPKSVQQARRECEQGGVDAPNEAPRP
jgi:hypothetical protein